jgi:hypothetical protein
VEHCSDGLPEKIGSSILAFRGVAPVKLTEMPCRVQADEECASRGRRDAGDGSRIEVADAQQKHIGQHAVRNAPQNIHGRGRETLPRRLCERCLKGSSRSAADEVRHGISQKQASEKVGYEM